MSWCSATAFTSFIVISNLLLILLFVASFNELFKLFLALVSHDWFSQKQKTQNSDFKFHRES